MRILGYVDHPRWKITVFKTDTRLSIKVENGQLEQTYKFRPTTHCNGLPDIQRILDEPFLAQIGQRFVTMEQDLANTFKRHIPDEEEEDFPEII
jgi:hypothetical protein